MEGTSSSAQVQTTENLPLNSDSQASWFNKNRIINIPYDKLEPIMEQPVDFEALRVNGFEVEEFFRNQGWLEYIKMLNGPVYTVLVKDFWPRCDIVDQFVADREYNNKVAEDPEKNQGSEIVITRSNRSQMLNLPNEGAFMTFTKGTGKKLPYVKRIAQECYINEDEIPTNKVSDMKETQRILARIMFGAFFPRKGGTEERISCPGIIGISSIS
ncbi:hypothetical protein A2U01_0024902 [Trifolium medium]|uniref:Cullin-like protein n=1 Tax=Trifolium medium TaxID=97028 RepID=A0A392NVL6_9FABA|nr:hypothetical protein [Trifolium medium]